MRYNRICMVLTLLTMAFILGGCVNVQDLTEKEADIVAEYSAGILLRYSDQYERRLITNENNKKETQPAVPVAAPVPTSDAAASSDSSAASTSTGEPDGSAGDTDMAGSGTDGSDASDGNADEAGIVSGQAAEDDTAEQVSLNDLFHIKGLDLSYQSYQFCSKYPKGDDDTFSITAGEGETLLVVHFQVRNKSGAKKKFSLGERAKNISYILNADGNEYQPGINILKNTGLNYLNTTIKKGGKEDAVLIFTMAEERQHASGISLQIKEGNRAVNLQLK